MEFLFFLILFDGKRRRGEFKIGLIVLAKSKPKGSISLCSFRVCSACVVDELVSVFLVLLEEVRMLRWCEPRGISYWAVSHLESCQSSMIEPLCESCQRL